VSLDLDRWADDGGRIPPDEPTARERALDAVAELLDVILTGDAREIRLDSLRALCSDPWSVELHEMNAPTRRHVRAILTVAARVLRAGAQPEAESYGITFEVCGHRSGRTFSLHVRGRLAS
jgi:hypothetical protein